VTEVFFGTEDEPDARYCALKAVPVLPKEKIIWFIL
jgi:hypothetical protein